jgi:hypothetical protein
VGSLFSSQQSSLLLHGVKGLHASIFEALLEGERVGSPATREVASSGIFKCPIPFTLSAGENSELCARDDRKGVTYRTAYDPLSHVAVREQVVWA